MLVRSYQKYVVYYQKSAKVYREASFTNEPLLLFFLLFFNWLKVIYKDLQA